MKANPTATRVHYVHNVRSTISRYPFSLVKSTLELLWNISSHGRILSPIYGSRRPDCERHPSNHRFLHHETRHETRTVQLKRHRTVRHDIHSILTRPMAPLNSSLTTTNIVTAQACLSLRQTKAEPPPIWRRIRAQSQTCPAW